MNFEFIKEENKRKQNNIYIIVVLNELQLKYMNANINFIQLSEIILNNMFIITEQLKTLTEI